MNIKNFTAHFVRPHMGRRMLSLAVGLTAMGACVAVFKTIGFGTDPCSTFTLGIASHTGVSFGTCQMVFNLLLFLPVLRFDLSRIGVGTIGNMVGVGYVADFCMAVINRLMPDSGLTLSARLLMFAAAMIVFLIAVSLYMAADLGVAPYDALPQLIAARSKKLSFRIVRMIWDITFLALGFLLGSTVGLTTVITGFFLGPVIVFVSNLVRPWFE